MYRVELLHCASWNAGVFVVAVVLGSSVFTLRGLLKAAPPALA
jgi:hypothetical protein